MKKNTFMRLAAVLLVLTLLSTSVIGGTFAKYTTTVSSSDSARVAKWGFNTASIDFENLFAASYDNVKDGSDELAIIAPGTKGSASFKFENSLENVNPEVAYTFTVSTADSSCAEYIQNNANIQWALFEGSQAQAEAATNVSYGNWNQLISAIENLAGDGHTKGAKQYDVGEIPDMIDQDYPILWQWTFDNSDDANAAATNDSFLGNQAVASDLVATLKVTISAVQVN